MPPSALLSAASKIQVQTIKQTIEASVLEVITSRKLQHVLRSFNHEAFQKVNYKLDLRQQPNPDNMQSR